MNSYTFWLVIFAFVSFVILTDDSVARALYMLTQIAKVQYEKTKWWMIHNPANPIVKYLMWRNAMKLAKELQDELKNK